MNQKIRNYQMYINGEFVESASKERAESRCPGDNEVIGTFPHGNEKDVDLAVAAAKAAFDNPEWSDVKNSVNRGRLLREIGQKLRDQIDKFAEIESLDSGKTITESSLIDVHQAADTFEYFADLSTSITGTVLPVPANVLDFTLREPLGVCGSISAWNFPIIFAAWKIAPALAAGNTVVYKPAELTSLSTLELTKIFDEVHLPAGVVNVVTGSGSRVGNAIASHPNIAKVSFTGSTKIGKMVQKAASDTLKKVTLELGGKSPNIVFDDASIDDAVSGSLNAIFFNAGECCIAGTRLLLHEAIYDKFLEKLVTRAKKIKVGHPLDWEARMGAIANRVQFEKIMEYIQWAKAQKYKILCGGDQPKPLPHPQGFYINPTIIEVPDNQSKLCQEEIFGPVLSVLKFSNEEEAVQIANDTPYGLASAVWTQNIKRGLRMAKKIKAGQVWINQYLTLSPLAPHGGYKQSGYGKDLSRYCLEEYTQIKNVYVDLEEGEYICLYE
ncbi:MAG: aldehyde dehydrogenase [Deltaproteobacteria bacterium]|nr:aldehyde dehydrogenase [Deltaproteobacteria bacterium]